MNAQEIRLALAKGIYADRMTLPLWDAEQEHVKGHYIGQAEKFMEIVKKVGLQLSEKQEVKVRERSDLVTEDEDSQQESEGEAVTEPDGGADLSMDGAESTGRKTGDYGGKRRGRKTK